MTLTRTRLMKRGCSLTAHSAIGLAAVIATSAISSAAAQSQGVRNVGTDSVVVVPGEIYRAGGFHRFWLGDNYRDLWTAPIKVPVLNVRGFHGGLEAPKEGGGEETKARRIVAAAGSLCTVRL